MVKQFDQSLIYLFIFRLCFLYSVQLVFNKLLVIYLFIFCQRHWNLVPEKTIEQLIKFWSKLWGGGLFDIEDSDTTNLVSCWQTEWIISSLPRASTARGSIFSDNPPKKNNIKIFPLFQSRDLRLKKNPGLPQLGGNLVHCFCTRSIGWSVFGVIFGKSICCSPQIK